MDAAERWALLPPIRRARGFYLYDYAGRRYLDFYQNGGRALLGHRPAVLSSRLKNLLSSGLLAELPSIHGPRLERALRSLVGPERVIRWYHDDVRARAAVIRVYGVDSPQARAFDRPADPAAVAATASGAGGCEAAREAAAVARLRPFVPPAAAGGEADLLLPVIPFPGAFAPPVLCFGPASRPPASDVVSPLLLAGLERVVLQLQRDPRWGGALCWLQPEMPQRKRRARAPVWETLETDLWRRIGPYLAWRGDYEDYDVVFEEFLKAGFILSPGPDEPSIIPGWCSHGDFARFAATCRSVECG